MKISLIEVVRKQNIHNFRNKLSLKAVIWLKIQKKDISKSTKIQLCKFHGIYTCTSHKIDIEEPTSYKEAV